MADQRSFLLALLLLLIEIARTTAAGQPGSCILSNGTVTRNGATFNLSPCSPCTCSDGELRCAVIDCARPICQNPVTPPGQCCPRCLGCAVVLCKPPLRCREVLGQARCEDFCYPGRCSRGQTCQETPLPCLFPPCPTVVKCTPTTTAPTTPTPICGPNEEFRRCGTACEPSCKLPNPLVCTEQCVVNVCQCRRGYLRSSNGRCIRPASCPSPTPTSPPACGPNEQFRQCGTACEPSCQQPSPHICTLQCILNVCQCQPGYVRSPSGQCIRPGSCPASPTPTSPPSCGANEHFRRCGSACEPTCAQPGARPCTRQCVRNVCQCKRGYLRSPRGQCVRLASCPLTTPANCPPGVTQVQCLIDPCQFAKCRAYPQATCHSHYCGDCAAEFHIHGRRVDCEPPTNPTQCPRYARFRSRGPRCYVECVSKYQYFARITDRYIYSHRRHPAGCYCRGGYIASFRFGKMLTCLRYSKCPRSLRRTVCA